MSLRRSGSVFALLFLLAVEAGTGPVAAGPPEIEGTWEGRIPLWNRDLRVVFRIARADDGSLSATMDGLDQGAVGVPVDEVVVEGESVRLTVTAFHGGFEGKFIEDGDKLEGEWTQAGGTLPLMLERTSAVAGPKPGQAPREVWQGALALEGVSLRVVFRVFEGEDGSLFVLMDSPDQGARDMIVDVAILEEDRVRFEVHSIEGVYDGTRAEDGATIEGTWKIADVPFPLDLYRVQAPAKASPAP